MSAYMWVLWLLLHAAPAPPKDAAAAAAAAAVAAAAAAAAVVPCCCWCSLEGYGPLMNASASRLAAWLEAYADSGREVDIFEALGRMTLEVVGTAAYG